MSAVMPDLRKPVMTLVDAAWEHPPGTMQTASARMEDKSAGGACIRVKTPIAAGSKIRISWRFDQFSGTVKYCRAEDKEYVVGIQRDATTTIPSADRHLEGEVSQFSTLERIEPEVSAASKTLPQPEEDGLREVAASKSMLTEVAPVAPPTAGAISVPAIAPLAANGDTPRLWPLQPPVLIRRTEIPKKRLPQRKSGTKRKPMPPKWFELANWRRSQEKPAPAGDEKGEDSGSRTNGKRKKENLMPNPNQPEEITSGHSARDVPAFQVELSPMEDIYRAAGIMIPRKGYSVNKVVEMLHSDHIRALSKEMRRAALLMALDAAGISLDQVQRDAAARQEALDSYESTQTKQIEDEWARKAEENSQIQAELESVKAHYMARIGRNLDGITREKAAFQAWLTLKQQECQSMAEAIDLCLKSPAPETAAAPALELSLAKAAGGKSV